MQDLFASRTISLSTGTTFQMGKTKNQANKVYMQPKNLSTTSLFFPRTKTKQIHPRRSWVLQLRKLQER